MYRKAIFAAFLLVLTGCDFEDFGSSAQFKEDFHYTFPLKPGGRVYLENFNGSVEVAGWGEDSCDISGTKYAASESLLQALKIDVIPSSDAIRIRTARPSERRGNMGAKYVLRVPKRTELERIATSNGSIHVEDIEGEGRLRTSNGSVRVLSFRGPLEARTSNGAVDIDGLEGAATVGTSNGRVQADRVRGAFSATTSNGRIELTMAELKENEIRAATSNASITVRLPASVGARIKASTSNSSVSTDFDVRREGASSRTRLDGVIGNGGPLVELTTSNGGIRIQKAAE